MHLAQCTLRPPLKKKIVSGPAVGCVYYCRMRTFFFHFAQKIIFLSKFHHFLTKKKKGKKKKILQPPDWPQFRPPAGQETKFFLRVA